MVQADNLEIFNHERTFFNKVIHATCKIGKLKIKEAKHSRILKLLVKGFCNDIFVSIKFCLD